MQTNQAFKILTKFGNTHDAKIIMEHFPKMSWIRVHYIAHLLRIKMPVAKIIHEKWFYGIPFYTNTHTLDPRPDTETLIESILSDKPQNVKILDIGTGTGCIIAALVKHIPGSTGLALDKSCSALKVAKQNIKKLNLDKYIQIKQADFSKPKAINGKFDIIVSNPPYISHNDSRVDAYARHDPKMALYAKHNGLYAYEMIAQGAKNWLKPNGKIYLEIGIGMLKNVKKIFTSNNWSFVRADRDLSGKYRTVVFQN